jgi:carbon starvation protein CstA
MRARGGAAKSNVFTKILLALFGFGFTPKALVVFLFALFPVIINVYEGASSVSERYIEVARSFRSGEARMWRDVVIPYTLPFAMTGIRLAIARALIGMIASEFFFSVSGTVRQMWPVFGAGNQLLGALALLAVTVWLAKTGINPIFTFIPMVFMFVVTLMSLFLFAWQNFQNQSYTLAVIATMLFLLAVVLIVMARNSLSEFYRKEKLKSPAPSRS